MWMMVLFDLPVLTKQERKDANRFRKFLLDQGFDMCQFSVYLRFCAGKEQTPDLHAEGPIRAAAIRQRPDHLLHRQAVREHRELQRTQAEPRQQKSGTVHAVLMSPTPFFLRSPACPASLGSSMAEQAVDFSRWEIGGQPQLEQMQARGYAILADGRSGANRNLVDGSTGWRPILADGRSGANRNLVDGSTGWRPILADGRSGANRNSASSQASTTSF